MLDPLIVLDRFGDEEFLRELWLRARQQLPAEMAEIEKLRLGSGSQLEIGKSLHKLRGLIANFLEGGQAISLLRQYEQVCQHAGPWPSETWEAFCQSLETESAELERWLTERGYPCC